MFVGENVEKESNWKVAGISVIGLTVTLLLMFQMAMMEPPYPGAKISFQGNELYFDSEQTTEVDAIQFGEELSTFGYFGKDYGQVAHLESLETRFILTLPVDKSLWKDQMIISSLNEFKTAMEVKIGKDVTLLLEHYDLTGNKVEKRL